MCYIYKKKTKKYQARIKLNKGTNTLGKKCAA